MTRISWLLMLVFAASLAMVQNCQANVIISFSNTGSFETFNVQVGGSVDIPIYLSGDSRLATQGLFSAGSTVNYAYDSGAGDVNLGNATIASVLLDPQWNSSVNFTDVNNSAGNQYAILEGLVDGPPVIPVTPAPGTDYIRLGSVTFQSGVTGNVTALSLSTNLNLQFINLLYNNTGGDPLDGQITFVGAKLSTITAVPEPSSMLMVAISAALIPLCRRRLNRHQRVG